MSIFTMPTIGSGHLPFTMKIRGVIYDLVKSKYIEESNFVSRKYSFVPIDYSEKDYSIREHTFKCEVNEIEYAYEVFS